MKGKKVEGGEKQGGVWEFSKGLNRRKGRICLALGFRVEKIHEKERKG